MKKAMKFLVPLMLGVLILASIVWYLFVYDRDFTRDTLLNQARYQNVHGNPRISSWFYDAAYTFSGHDKNIAIELANQYKGDGNYTKAEVTLTEAIRNAPTPELYTALSRTYVEQDKILDAMNLLDKLGNPEIKAALDKARPSAPATDAEGGFYSQYIQVNLQADNAKYLFYTTDGEFPSIQGSVFHGAIPLTAGETVVTAVAVSESGLVSPLSVYHYTITGVIEEVTFTDAAMDKAVRELIGVAEGKTLMSDQLWKITEFTAPEGVKSYEDLKLLPNLTKLTIKNMTVDTLSHLSSLVKLETLDLSGSTFPVSDLTILPTLPSLKSLTLAGCRLSTVENLADCKTLTYLDLSSNTIRNLTPLSTMPQLSEVKLRNNAVNSLDALSGLENLTSLDVSFNALSSLAPLSNCVRMTKLTADNNQLINLVGLEKTSLLTHLSVNHNQISDLSGLPRNPELQELRIASNDVFDLTALESLKKLTLLDFSGNHVEALPNWPDDAALQTIDGSYNALQSIDSLANQQALTHVYMDYNLLTNIDALENCFCLVQVNVFGNAIPDVSLLREKDIIVNYDPTAAVAAEE